LARARYQAPRLFIHTSTASFLVGESHQTRAAGSRATDGFFSQ
jgi:hypothetical protein